MEDWRYQYPSVHVNRTYRGNKLYAMGFNGEANLLLYKLKNLMKFRNLGQLKMTRLFTDGTRITAWSVFGQDFLKIDVTQVDLVAAVAVIEQKCIITFIDFPESVQPMQNPHMIVDGEVEGTDYIKTYYTLDLTECEDCSEIGWEFILEYETPFESRHWINPVTEEEDITDHTVYSMDYPAWGEIITHDHDDLGTYIIWKAYTEANNPFSRTGLAIPLLRASIFDTNGNTVCTQEAKFDVDCCLKNSNDRKVEIWWEDFGTCQPYIPYSGVAYNAICLTPNSMPWAGTAGFVWYACTSPEQPFYAIPEIKGSCLPLEWTLSGPIDFLGSDKNDHIIFFKCLDAGCRDEATITLTDRCGGTYIVRTNPCCDEAAELSISYTTLLMSCSQQQTLSTIGGCGPYSWALTGGLGSLSTDYGNEVVYTSPATNPNCTSNPTIQVTDCCGSTAQIQLAVNCYADGAALKVGDATQTECYWYTGNHCHWWGSYYCDTYDCAGTLLLHQTGGIDMYVNSDPGCAVGPIDEAECIAACGLGPQGRCADNTICGLNGWGLNDIRTEEMKEQGCCPLNPETGLPY